MTRTTLKWVSRKARPVHYSKTTRNSHLAPRESYGRDDTVSDRHKTRAIATQEEKRDTVLALGSHPYGPKRLPGEHHSWPVKKEKNYC